MPFRSLRGQIGVFDLESGEQIACFEQPEGKLAWEDEAALLVSPSGDRLIAIGWEAEWMAWDLQDLSHVRTHRLSIGTVARVLPHPAGSGVYISAKQGGRYVFALYDWQGRPLEDE